MWDARRSWGLSRRVSWRSRDPCLLWFRDESRDDVRREEWLSRDDVRREEWLSRDDVRGG